MRESALGKRMKGYEKAFDSVLPNRMPIIIRLDGKAFHTFTRKMDKPFDEKFIDAMAATALYTTKEVQTSVFSYTQSDEISLLLFNYNKFESQLLFHNRVQKLVSVAASTATSYLNVYMGLPLTNLQKFDARVFILPKEEVVNYFIWRQQDAETNSVNMLAQSLYSHKELQGKNNSQLQELCFLKGMNWDKLETYKKRGLACYKSAFDISNTMSIDKNIPIFIKDRNFIERLIVPEEI